MACVARLEPTAKGQDVLFQVLQQPRWKERPLELNLYGAGSWGDSLRRLAEGLHLQNVHFCGHVNDVRRIWEQNHILVLPSRYEGLPLAVVEAMWCGRPAIVTDIAGNAEVCVDGETGFVADAPTAKLLDETLERAWNQRRDWHRMGLAARARAEKLIPKDPVGLFCQQLQEIAQAACGRERGLLQPDRIYLAR
jgi:glycosyltransferase involved in cell wall biosynthesis